MSLPAPPHDPPKPPEGAAQNPYLAPIPGASPFEAIAPAGVETGPRGGTTTHPLAYTAVVLGLGCCLPFSGLLSVVCGVLAVRAIRAKPGVYRGEGLAVVGIVLGAVQIMGTMVAYIGAGFFHWMRLRAP